MEVSRDFGQRLQVTAHELAARVSDCARAADALSRLIDDIAAGPPARVTFATHEENIPLDRAVRLAADALVVKEEIRRRVVTNGFWTNRDEQRALLRWIVQRLEAPDAAANERA